MFFFSGVEAETKQALENIGLLLRAAGADYGNVVKCTVLMADIGEFQKMNQIYGQFFADVNELCLTS